MFLVLPGIDENSEIAKQASCAAYVKDEIGLPPVLLLHGEKDGVVSADHSGNAFWSKEILKGLHVCVI